MQNQLSSLGGVRKFTEWPKDCHLDFGRCDHACRVECDGCVDPQTIPPPPGFFNKCLELRLGGLVQLQAHSAQTRKSPGTLLCFRGPA